MIYAKRILGLLVMYVPFLLCGQTGGVSWTAGLSWQQVKEKARTENKYIFLDCYATWCGPCKVMDRDVYPDARVGKYFNDKFVSIRVQMDKTENDNEIVKSWYKDADLIGKEYHVEGFPTFIFISPEGVTVSKEMGGMSADRLLELARAALVPGKVYNDPFAEYYQLKEEYNRGIKNYERFPFMISMAYKARDEDFGKMLLHEHSAYVSKLSREKRYTKDNIEMWSGFALSSQGPRFDFFYRDGDVIDRVMQKKGFAQNVVDRTVWEEIVQPFLDDQAKGSEIAMKGMYVGGPGASLLKTDSGEADWKRLYSLIRKKFNRVTAKRNVVSAKSEWYQRHRNWPLYCKYESVKLSKYTPEYNDDNLANINSFIWKTFIHITDKKLLIAAIPIGRKAVEVEPRFTMLLDSYANLLYKSGNVKEAIHWQQIAIQQTPTNKGMKEALEQMKRGESTYIKSGAIWK